MPRDPARTLQRIRALSGPTLGCVDAPVHPGSPPFVVEPPRFQGCSPVRAGHAEQPALIRTLFLNPKVAWTPRGSKAALSLVLSADVLWLGSHEDGQEGPPQQGMAPEP